MKTWLAFVVVVVVVVGLSVAAEEDDSPGADPTLPPESDYRLAKVTDAEIQRIGLFTYYPNKGGGCTFLEGKKIAFYSLPYGPTTYPVQSRGLVKVRNARGVRAFPGQRWEKASIIGTREMPFGGRTVYRSEMRATDRRGLPRRVDTPIAKWTRDTPDGKFRFTTISDDHETRLKLKSIVPVLENAGRGR
jgi:hypothetical protein